VFDAGVLGSTYRRGCLLEFVGTLFPEIGDQKNAMCPCECSFKGFRPVQICRGDFVGKFAMFAWIAGQSADLELAAGLQGTYNSASLLARCTDYGDQILVVG
jgi:hypothetical protein